MFSYEDRLRAVQLYIKLPSAHMLSMTVVTWKPSNRADRRNLLCAPSYAIRIVVLTSRFYRGEVWKRTGKTGNS